MNKSNNICAQARFFISEQARTCVLYISALNHAYIRENMMPGESKNDSLSGS